MVFLGLNAAISVRVSNELGPGRPRAAKQAVVAQSLAMGLVAMALVLAYRNSFAVLFTGDRAMQAAVGKVAYLLAATMVLNSVQPVISGVAIGGGWQALVAYINLGCYYALGLPLGFCMGYLLRLGAQGIWAGMLCGTALQTLILLALIWNTDWEAEVCSNVDGGYSVFVLSMAANKQWQTGCPSCIAEAIYHHGHGRPRRRRNGSSRGAAGARRRWSSSSRGDWEPEPPATSRKLSECDRLDPCFTHIHRSAADSDALRNQIKHSLGRLISSFGLIRHRLPKRHRLTQSMTFLNRHRITRSPFSPTKPNIYDENKCHRCCHR